MKVEGWRLRSPWRLFGAPCLMSETVGWGKNKSTFYELPAPQTADHWAPPIKADTWRTNSSLIVLCSCRPMSVLTILDLFFFTLNWHWRCDGSDFFFGGFQLKCLLWWESWVHKFTLESHPRCIGCTFLCAFLIAFVCLQVFISAAGGKTLRSVVACGHKDNADRIREALSRRPASSDLLHILTSYLCRDRIR